MEQKRIDLLLDILGTICIVNLLHMVPSEMSKLIISYMICFIILRNRRQ